ncbi:hypothetical protein PB2503_07789 [Parvularcula bermudensis HTCC2503]|uniref:Pseudouridine synthase n=2 Tax=Parvularcula TaxID=208215 RepID=E0TGJ4_PARBH|nr:hypothetical protein PB2503_07789 [Parvularcula bermudensis HTCC2503]
MDEEMKGERLAKVMARAGVASRRGAETLIAEGRVTIDGRPVETPATLVTGDEDIRVDGSRLRKPEAPRLWRYHKPSGLVTTHKDPQGRQTVFDNLPTDLPRVLSVGRLDLTTEGLLLLTNDGGLSRLLELPSTGWKRRYRVRAYGRLAGGSLGRLSEGLTVEGVRYGPIQAKLDRRQGDNLWLTVAIAEGKNREVRAICRHLGLTVNRLIRVSYGPFQLGHLAEGEVEEVPRKQLIEQVGRRHAASLGLIAGR